MDIKLNTVYTKKNTTESFIIIKNLLNSVWLSGVAITSVAIRTYKQITTVGNNMLSP